MEPQEQSASFVTKMYLLLALMGRHRMALHGKNLVIHLLKLLSYRIITDLSALHKRSTVLRPFQGSY